MQSSWVTCDSVRLHNVNFKEVKHTQILKDRTTRSLVGYSPRDRKESDMAEATMHAHHDLCQRTRGPEEADTDWGRVVTMVKVAGNAE